MLLQLQAQEADIAIEAQAIHTTTEWDCFLGHNGSFCIFWQL